MYRNQNVPLLETKMYICMYVYSVCDSVHVVVQNFGSVLASIPMCVHTCISVSIEKHVVVQNFGTVLAYL